ncbi:hypothetical protein T439DRAFT_383214 [Meredithblackwellia eburnea MCA 4105]
MKEDSLNEVVGRLEVQGEGSGKATSTGDESPIQQWHIDDFPEELLDQIFEHLPSDEKPFLCQLAVVCKSFVRPAQRQLGRELNFWSGVAQKWLDSPSPRLGKDARYVQFNFDTEDIIVRVMSRCESLVWLSLGGTPDEVDWYFLCLPGLSGLRHLYLHPNFILKDPPDNVGLRLPLTSISLSCYRADKSPCSSKFFETLFTGASATLRNVSINLGLEGRRQAFCDHLHLLSDSLEHMFIDMDYSSSSDPEGLRAGLVKSFPALPSLRSLEFDQLDDNFHTYMSLLRPGQIRRLKFFVHQNTTLKWVALITTLPALCSLERLTITHWPTFDYFKSAATEEQAELTAFVEKNKIQMRWISKGDVEYFQ